MRPATHDDPNAIPRNGTEVPWLDLADPNRSSDAGDRRPRRRDGGAASTAGDRPRRR